MKSTFVLILVLSALGAVIIGFHAYQNRVQAKATLNARHQRSIRRESTELAIASQLRSNTIRMKSLRTEDQIAALEGRPAQNRMAIVDLENRQMFDGVYKSEQDDTLKEAKLLEESNTDDKPFPDLFAAQQAAMEDYISTIVARRLANAEGDKDANEATARALAAARERALATAEKYKEALDAISRQNGR